MSPGRSAACLCRIGPTFPFLETGKYCGNCSCQGGQRGRAVRRNSIGPPGPHRLLWLPRQLGDHRTHPVRRRTGVATQSPAVIGGQRMLQPLNHPRVDSTLPQVPQRLERGAPGRTGAHQPSGRSTPEEDDLVAEAQLTRRPIRDERRPCGDLGREAERVGGLGARHLKYAAGLAGIGTGHRIRRWGQVAEARAALRAARRSRSRSSRTLDLGHRENVQMLPACVLRADLGIRTRFRVTAVRVRVRSSCDPPGPLFHSSSRRAFVSDMGHMMARPTAPYSMM